MSTEPIDLTLLEPVLHKYHGRRRDALLPMLHDAQAVYGWLPTEVQEAVSKTLRVPLADIHGVIEFYTMFYNRPMARTVVRVCEDVACQLAGCEAIHQAVSEKLGLQHGQMSVDGGAGRAIAYERVPCLGMCEHAPNALYGEKPAGDLTVTAVDDFLAGTYPEPDAKIYGEPKLKLFRVGQIDPLSLDDYLAHEGYVGLQNAMQHKPEEIIQWMDASNILGRGGAMFPVGNKWKFTRAAPGTPAQKHIIANCDESEPGTFKDRGLMEEDPFSLVEAMTLAAYVVGAENGWIFIRGEYPRSHKRLVNAVEKARAAGYLGKNILGRPGFNFDIEVRLGAGAYICGEETALFEAIEGKRGFPRIKPPFPTTHGLFHQPTAINNVETLVAALAVARIGWGEWAAYGTEDSKGTKWFCLSGHVNQPGLYELPFGVTVRELIEMGGGVKDGRAIQSVLVGGAAGRFLSPAELDYPLTYASSRNHAFPIGSGVVMVIDDQTDMRHTLYHLAHFFAHESCGKCFPCQIGTQRQMEILHHISHNGGPQPGDKERLLDVGFTMTETSLCGLGQTAASAIVSAINLWPELVE
ncbi:MAG TPA: NAD(P)H-dependent oxidoreductase subunit E [Chloroflexota bacterium]|nr:NAD(P)H-dependent oxidoreductase subunit E [Chloroflexota bacterium]